IPGDTVVELEEAFITSQSLPADLQVKAGLYLTEFGRLNPTHPHAWEFMDQPVVLTRMFGADGMRAPGARVSWLLPTDNYTEFTPCVQTHTGEQMKSSPASEQLSGDRPVGGRLFVPRGVQSFADMLYSGRIATSFDLGDASSTALGASVAFGP